MRFLALVNSFLKTPEDFMSTGHRMFSCVAFHSQTTYRYDGIKKWRKNSRRNNKTRQRSTGIWQGTEHGEERVTKVNIQMNGKQL